MSAVPPFDPALREDLSFLKSRIYQALAKGGITFGFQSSSAARKARRRMYHVAQYLEGMDRQNLNKIEFKLCGRMIAFVPKQTLSSSIPQEEVRSFCPQCTTGVLRNGKCDRCQLAIGESNAESP